MKLTAPDWRHFTDADRETVARAIAERQVKSLAAENRVTTRTVTTWRKRLGFVPVRGTYGRGSRVKILAWVIGGEHAFTGAKEVHPQGPRTGHEDHRHS